MLNKSRVFWEADSDNLVALEESQIHTAMRKLLLLLFLDYYDGLLFKRRCNGPFLPLKKWVDRLLLNCGHEDASLIS